MPGKWPQPTSWSAREGIRQVFLGPTDSTFSIRHIPVTLAYMVPDFTAPPSSPFSFQPFPRLPLQTLWMFPGQVLWHKRCVGQASSVCCL